MPLELPPSKGILISNTWGFVLVNYGKEIAVFTVNGTKIGCVSHSCETVYWTTVTDARDFDYLVYDTKAQQYQLRDRESDDVVYRFPDISSAIKRIFNL